MPIEMQRRNALSDCRSEISSQNQSCFRFGRRKPRCKSLAGVTCTPATPPNGRAMSGSRLPIISIQSRSNFPASVKEQAPSFRIQSGLGAFTLLQLTSLEFLAGNRTPPVTSMSGTGQAQPQPSGTGGNAGRQRLKCKLKRVTSFQLARLSLPGSPPPIPIPSAGGSRFLQRTAPRDR